MSNTTLGIIIMLISTSIMQIGVCLQKGALDKMPKLNSQSAGKNVKGVFSNKVWVAGWVMTTSAIVLQSVALSYADMTVIQPLIAWGLVVLVVFSHYYLGEKIHKNEAIGIIIAIIGVIILGLKAGQSQEFDTVEQIFTVYNKTNTFVLYAIFLIIAACFWFTSVRTNYKDKGVIFALDASIFSVLGLTLSKGVFSILNIKGFSDTLAMWETYALLGSWIFLSTMAIIFQQMSLQRGKSIIVTPVFNLSSMLIPIITGAIVFLEVITIWKIISTIIIIIGAIFLSYPTKIDKIAEEISESLEDDSSDISISEGTKKVKN